jgi:hypothetical protein
MIAATAVKVLAVVGAGVAGTTVAAHAGIVPPGIATALQHVPTWTHAHSVLEAIQRAFAHGQHPGQAPSGPPGHAAPPSPPTR